MFEISKRDPKPRGFEITNIEASQLNNIRTQRAGVIPYFVDQNGDISFLLARHAASKELGDFGGGVRKCETTLIAAFREFEEESLGLFSEFYPTFSSLEKCVAFTDRQNMSIIFAPVCGQVENVPQRFSTILETLKTQQPRKRSISEISEILWVSESEFIDLVQSKTPRHGEQIWKKVQGFLRRIKISKIFEETRNTRQTLPCPISKSENAKIFEVYA